MNSHFMLEDSSPFGNHAFKTIAVPSLSSMKSRPLSPWKMAFPIHHRVVFSPVVLVFFVNILSNNPYENPSQFNISEKQDASIAVAPMWNDSTNLNIFLLPWKVLLQRITATESDKLVGHGQLLSFYVSFHRLIISLPFPEKCPKTFSGNCWTIYFLHVTDTSYCAGTVSLHVSVCLTQGLLTDVPCFTHDISIPCEMLKNTVQYSEKCAFHSSSVGFKTCSLILISHINGLNSTTRP